MHTYVVNTDGTAVVGRLERRRVGDVETDEFMAMHDTRNVNDALRLVNFLNGGDGSSGHTIVAVILEQGAKG